MLAGLLDRGLQERPAGRAATIEERGGEVDAEEKTETGCGRWDQFQHGERSFVLLGGFVVTTTASSQVAGAPRQHHRILGMTEGRGGAGMVGEERQHAFVVRPRSQDGGDRRVKSQPGARPHRVVADRAEQRMHERETQRFAWISGDEPGVLGRFEGLQHGPEIATGGGGDEIGVECRPDHHGDVEELHLGRRQPIEPGAEQAADGVDPTIATARLQGQQWVAASCGVHLLCGPAPPCHGKEPGDVFLGEGRQADHFDAGLAAELGEESGQRVVEIGGRISARQHEQRWRQHRPGGRGNAANRASSPSTSARPR